MPLVILAPLASFVLALSSVRTRRSAANLSRLGLVVMLLATLLIAWGLAKKSTGYTATYSYINLSVAFTGPANFQNFVMDIVLRVDHISVAALLVVEVCVLGALGWHQLGGRSEPGPARFYAATSALLFGAAGVLLSWDLAELLAFWGIAAVMTYLLLAHRWGSEDAANRSRVVLALPFLTDLSLLCGVGWLYARYGDQHIDALFPILHTTAGWTVRALVVASILLLIGVAGRMALWPLHSWMTRTALTAPPAAEAIAQSVWPVLGVVVLYRLMPISAAANLQTVRVSMYACAVAAVVAALLAVFSNEPRRAVTLLGSGVAAAGAAIVIHGFESTTFRFAAAGVACVFAAAPARAAGFLSISSIAGAMRTDNLAEMGDAWRRLRESAVALGLAVLALGFCLSGALAFAVATRSWLAVALGEAVLLIAVGGLRVFLGTALGPLRRRRAFEPDRVTEVAPGWRRWPFWLGVASAALVVAGELRGWLGFLDGYTHPNPPASLIELWLGVPAVACLLTTLAFLLSKDGSLMASSVAGRGLESAMGAGGELVTRFLVAPSTDAARRLEMWIHTADRSIGRLSSDAGRLTMPGTRAPLVGAAILGVSALALGVALLAPGVFR